MIATPVAEPFDIINNNYFKDQAYGFFIECGASDGISESVCLPFEWKGWAGINIEASQSGYTKLVINRPHSYANIHAALSNKSGTVTFSEVIPPSKTYVHLGSIQHPKEYQELLQKNGYQTIKYDVPMLTYTDIVNRYRLPRVDLMVLDVEGHELPVLEGMKTASLLPSVMCIEYPWIGIETLKEACKALKLEFDFASYNNAFFSNREKIKAPKNPFGATEILPLKSFIS